MPENPWKSVKGKENRGELPFLSHMAWGLAIVESKLWKIQMIKKKREGLFLKAKFTMNHETSDLFIIKEKTDTVNGEHRRQVYTKNAC